MKKRSSGRIWEEADAEVHMIASAGPERCRTGTWEIERMEGKAAEQCTVKRQEVEMQDADAAGRRLDS